MCSGNMKAVSFLSSFSTCAIGSAKFIEPLSLPSLQLPLLSLCEG
jgi:hypothetical protein